VEALMLLPLALVALLALQQLLQAKEVMVAILLFPLSHLMEVVVEEALEHHIGMVKLAAPVVAQAVLAD